VYRAYSQAYYVRVVLVDYLGTQFTAVGRRSSDRAGGQARWLLLRGRSQPHHRKLSWLDSWTPQRGPVPMCFGSASVTDASAARLLKAAPSAEQESSACDGDSSPPVSPVSASSAHTPDAGRRQCAAYCDSGQSAQERSSSEPKPRALRDLPGTEFVTRVHGVW
jgi:hypothetical protein